MKMVPLSFSSEDHLPQTLEKISVPDILALVAKVVIQIDERLSTQLSAIIEHPRFASLESSWRGVDTIVSEPKTPDVKVKLLDQSWEEVAQDLEASGNERNSSLYGRIGREELDTLGGEPFGILLIDHALSINIHSEYDDFFVAQLIASLGARCLCPVILSVSPDFFGEKDAAWITNIPRIKNIISGNEDYASWHNLRKSPHACFIGLAWPEVQMRGRYEDLDIGFRFHQWPSQSDGLWGNAGYTFLRTVIAEFSCSAWFGYLKLINQPGRGAIPGANHAAIPDGTKRIDQCRIRLTQAMGQFLSEEGFIPLCESIKSHDLYFAGNRSVADCQNDPTKEILTQIQSTMTVCRIAHYVKVIARFLIGQTQTVSECEIILNNWLEDYCAPLSEATPDVLANYPFRRARAQIYKNIYDSSRFSCVITVQPQYQVDHMTSDIRISTEILSQQRR